MTQTRLERAVFFGAVVLAGLCARPSAAQADPRLSFEIAGALVVDEYAREVEQWEADPGLVTALAAGWEWRSGAWSFVPEVGFGSGVFTDPFGRRVFSIAGGARVLWGTAFRPYVAHHVGWGTEQGDEGDAMLSDRGLAIDAALGLDVPIDARWSMAAELSYRVLLAETGSGTEPTHWPSLGVAFVLRP